MNAITRNLAVVLVFAALSLSLDTLADQSGDIRHLQSRWAEVNYQLAGKAQKTAFEQLIETAEQTTTRHPESPEAWIWSGIIKSSYAGVAGGLSALKYAKAAKSDLEAAMNIDDSALSGSAYTSLGTLYAQVPGWPLGFGNDKKAEKMLKKAVSLNPNGIDSNYFYGRFLADEGRYQEARTYLTRARQAPSRPDRPLADAGRHEEIDKALAEVGAKLAK
jgi:tetratricopeptide (TPR) repeat protein